MLFVAIGGDVERREKNLTRVFHTCQEVDDFFLLLHYPIHLLLAVGNSFGFEDPVPEAVGNLDVILDRCRILQFSFLCHTDESLDIIPVALKQRTIIRDWIIGTVRCWNTADDGELSRVGFGLLTFG